MRTCIATRWSSSLTAVPPRAISITMSLWLISRDSAAREFAWRVSFNLDRRGSDSTGRQQSRSLTVELCYDGGGSSNLPCGPSRIREKGWKFSPINRYYTGMGSRCVPCKLDYWRTAKAAPPPMRIRLVLVIITASALLLMSFVIVPKLREHRDIPYARPKADVAALSDAIERCAADVGVIQPLPRVSRSS